MNKEQARKVEERNQFLVERLAAIGGKIVQKVEAKRIPSNEEMAFFKKCYDAVCSSSVNQEVRAYWIDLPEFVEEAKKARLAFISMKKAALENKAAEQEAIRKARSAKISAAREKGAAMSPKDLADIEQALLSPRES